MFTIMEDDTTRWEKDIVNMWTAKAQDLVDQDSDNVFEQGIRDYNMSIDKLVRGYDSDAPNLTVKQVCDRTTVLTDAEACKLIVDRAWRCSIEYFLRKNKNQVKVQYSPTRNIVGSEEDSERRRQSVTPPKEVTSFPNQHISATLY